MAPIPQWIEDLMFFMIYGQVAYGHRLHMEHYMKYGHNVLRYLYERSSHIETKKKDTV